MPAALRSWTWFGPRDHTGFSMHSTRTLVPDWQPWSFRPSQTVPHAVALAQRRLERTGYAVLRQLRCEFRDGHLRLSGCVPSQYLKQVVLTAIADVEGAETVIIDVEVASRAGNREAVEGLSDAE